MSHYIAPEDGREYVDRSDYLREQSYREQKAYAITYTVVPAAPGIYAWYQGVNDVYSWPVVAYRIQVPVAKTDGPLRSEDNIDWFDTYTGVALVMSADGMIDAEDGTGSEFLCFGKTKPKPEEVVA